MIKRQTIFFVITVLIILGIVFTISGAVLPFLIAAILSYLLKPAIDFLERRFCVRRSIISFAAVGVFCIFILSMLIILFPIIYGQFNLFIKQTPFYKHYILSNFIPYISE